LLETLFTEGIESGGIFEGGYESILVVGVGTRGVKHGGYIGIEICHLEVVWL